MSKLTVTLPDELHAQIRQELEAQGITTGQFIEMVVTKYFTKSKEGENNMATRTIAFQVSEELYQRIKEYLNRYQEVYGRKLTQREFMLQLIVGRENEPGRKLCYRAGDGGTGRPEGGNTAGGWHGLYFGEGRECCPKTSYL